MPVDPFFSSRLPLLNGIVDYQTGLSDPDQARRLQKYAEPPVDWLLPKGVTVETTSLPGPNGPFDVRVYTPSSAPSAGLVWAHGGGWSAGSLEMPEAHVVAAEMAARKNIVVASVGYHLASAELKYPAPLDDLVAAWKWMHARKKEEFGSDGHLAIGGASAGASLAMGATMRVRDEGLPLPSHMLLAYPLVHFPIPALAPELAREMLSLPPLARFPAERIEMLQRGYVGRLVDLPVYSVPGHGKLGGLPPTRLLISEYDDLRPSADLLAIQLREAGVPVVTHLAEGMLHGHLNWPPGEHLPEIIRSLDFLSGFIGG